MTSYQQEFSAASARTNRYGFTPTHPQLIPGVQFISAAKVNPLLQLVARALRESERQQLAFNCLDITRALVDPVAELLGCEVFYTLGWLDNKGVHTYEFDETRIEQVLRDGHTAQTASSLHAWLTLPSLELLDATLATSIGVLQARADYIGQIIAGPADSLREPAYRPMLLGTEYLLYSPLAAA